MSASLAPSLAAPSRRLVELTSAESARLISETSILCLPLGSIEQHGPHLPLNTDLVIAEGLTRRIVARWGDEFDLWQLPSFALGLSREHDWAAGTLSLSIQNFAALLREIAREIVRATPSGALAVGVTASAVIYVMTFFALGVATDFRYGYWCVLASLAGIAAAAVAYQERLTAR